MPLSLNELIRLAKPYDPDLVAIPIDPLAQEEAQQTGRVFLTAILVSGAAMMIWPLTVIGLPAFLFSVILGIFWLGLRDDTHGFAWADKARLERMLTLLNAAQFLRNSGRVVLQVASATMAVVGLVSIVVFVGFLFILAIGMGANSR